jgi:1-acyl-sn-glycerol-3-phosphate acyltransferase
VYYLGFSSKMKLHHIPFHIKLNRMLMLPAFRVIYRMLGRVKVTGQENVPLGKAYLIAMNHISIFDPPLVVSFWPEAPEVIGAADVFEKKGQGQILSMYGVIPVHRGDYDRVLLDKIFTILKSGRPLVIAPEGGRSHVPAMQRAMPGVGYIVEHAKVPVIPVGLVGTTDDFWQQAKKGLKPQLEMRIGKPIVFPSTMDLDAARKEVRQKKADYVMRTIAGLLPEEYHGVYAGQSIAPA